MSRSLTELEIAVNGPSLAHCDTVVREAMDHYWREKSKENIATVVGTLVPTTFVPVKSVLVLS